MSPFNNHHTRVETCNDAHCQHCLVCTETNFETVRRDKWKHKALPHLNELYKALYLLQLKNKIAESR